MDHLLSSVEQCLSMSMAELMMGFLSIILRQMAQAFVKQDISHLGKHVAQ